MPPAHQHTEPLTSALMGAQLQLGFLRSAKRFPERPAVEAAGMSLTYAALREQAASIAATLQTHTPGGGAPLTAVFAYRTPTAFAGVLAALLAGTGYVPLNRTFPPQRSRLMLERADCRALVADRASAGQLDALLEMVRTPLLVVLPEEGDVREQRRRWPLHTWIGASELVSAEDWRPPTVSPDALAYLLYTSGSTGVPKGVGVTHANALSFIREAVERYEITEHDRLSQTYDMTFDPSVFDMFTAWECGGCVCCPSQRTLVKPGRFIIESRLTVWYSVPSIAIFMKRFGELQPGRYPDLRLSMFVGEPLPVAVADTWQEAAPNSVVENTYGPTEVTVVCTGYTWNAARSPGESVRGVVPIGYLYETMEAIVVDEALTEVTEGETGELLLAGPQVTPGYWRDPERTALSFVTPPGRDAIFYRTGDRVRRPQPGDPYVYLGRIDHQIKVGGHRVELGEIEAAIRDASGAEEVVAIGWPLDTTGASGVVAFIGGSTVDAEVLRARLSERLPYYMVPHTVRLLSQLPLNANGKFDRKHLTAMLESS